ncbi:hypothetical protein PGT21_023516 [Puccinia graminis f. sp. tritici]|uniref:Uncharacterized protein n=1 Tax=Puccinia graminis f. sp. tritici TaxID=56615 RepID=A0A5B0MAM6_PUCGR|nr:hypothetical protein PGT21_023516 [Puccinia graminis f. sp. tritici]KAA1132780.1 hypothetical protein PGTUg99_012333 [Puccinia graminis f. sp. tritici]
MSLASAYSRLLREMEIQPTPTNPLDPSAPVPKSTVKHYCYLTSHVNILFPKDSADDDTMRLSQVTFYICADILLFPAPGTSGGKVDQLIVSLTRLSFRYTPDGQDRTRLLPDLKKEDDFHPKIPMEIKTAYPTIESDSSPGPSESEYLQKLTIVYLNEACMSSAGRG